MIVNKVHYDEITLDDCKLNYPIYPTFEVIKNTVDISVLTYVVSKDGFLVPLYRRYNDIAKTFNGLREWVFDIEAEAGTIGYEGFKISNIFEGKSKCIINNCVLEIKKIIDYEVSKKENEWGTKIDLP